MPAVVGSQAVAASAFSAVTLRRALPLRVPAGSGAVQRPQGSSRKRKISGVSTYDLFPLAPFVLFLRFLASANSVSPCFAQPEGRPYCSRTDADQGPQDGGKCLATRDGVAHGRRASVVGGDSCALSSGDGARSRAGMDRGERR